LSHVAAPRLRLPCRRSPPPALGSRGPRPEPLSSNSHAWATARASGLSQSGGRALLLSALAADGPRRQPLQLPPRPGHHAAPPARRRTPEHRPAAVLRYDACALTEFPMPLCPSCPLWLRL